MAKDSAEGRAKSDEERRAEFAAEAAKAPSMTRAEHRRRSRRSVLTGAAGMAAGVFGWRWLQGQEEDNNIPKALRRAHENNEKLWSALYRENALAPTFDLSSSSMMRVNGRHGIREEINLDQWSLSVLDGTGVDDGGPDDPPLLGTHVLSDFTSLPKVEMTVEHKCVEGWSHIVTWGGVRFSDFAERYSDAMKGATHVALATPDEEFYVGLDIASMMHPQTLLAYELQQVPLTQEHGAPLRLVTPLKYGTKQLKRIGSIRFANVAPDDFWHQRGYDYYAGL